MALLSSKAYATVGKRVVDALNITVHSWRAAPASTVRCNRISRSFRQVRMARHFERREDVVMYAAMLDLISNRVQQPAGVAASKSEADQGVGVEWCEPIPIAVEQLVADAIDLILVQDASGVTT